MPRFDMYCNHCGYEGEHILKTADAKAYCPVCEEDLHKGISFPNISTSKTRDSDEDIFVDSIGELEEMTGVDHCHGYDANVEKNK